LKVFSKSKACFLSKITQYIIKNWLYRGKDAKKLKTQTAGGYAAPRTPRARTRSMCGTNGTNGLLELKFNFQSSEKEVSQLVHQSKATSA
jgi:hypothetical protein